MGACPWSIDRFYAAPPLGKVELLSRKSRIVPRFKYEISLKVSLSEGSRCLTLLTVN